MDDNKKNKISSYNPEWYKQNRDNKIAIQKAYYTRNRDVLAARCRDRKRMKAEFKRFCAIQL